MEFANKAESKMSVDHESIKHYSMITRKKAKPCPLILPFKGPNNDIAPLSLQAYPDQNQQAEKDLTRGVLRIRNAMKL